MPFWLLICSRDEVLSCVELISFMWWIWYYLAISPIGWWGKHFLKVKVIRHLFSNDSGLIQVSVSYSITIWINRGIYATSNWEWDGNGAENILGRPDRCCCILWILGWIKQHVAGNLLSITVLAAEERVLSSKANVKSENMQQLQIILNFFWIMRRDV